MRSLDELATRPALYLTETGLPHLTGGILMFLIGAAGLTMRFLLKTDVTQAASIWIGLCAVVAVRWGANLLKKKVVFPRGGYVKVLPSKSGAIALVLGLATFLLLLTLVGPLAGYGFVTLLAVATLACGWRVKACFGVYLLCLAAALWALPVTRVEQSALLQFGAGVPLAIVGGLILRTFLRANPKHPELSNE